MGWGGLGSMMLVLSQGKGQGGVFLREELLFCIRTFRWGKRVTFVVLLLAFYSFSPNPPPSQQIVLLALALLGVRFCMANMINVNPLFSLAFLGDRVGFEIGKIASELS